MKYYSILRPISIGAFPREGAGEIVNFNRRQYIPEIGREAWGYIDYSRDLANQEAAAYDLVPEDATTAAMAKITDSLRSKIPSFIAAKVQGEDLLIAWRGEDGKSRGCMVESFEGCSQEEIFEIWEILSGEEENYDC